jgi:hypothetical protein
MEIVYAKIFFETARAYAKPCILSNWRTTKKFQGWKQRQKLNKTSKQVEGISALGN